MREIYSEQEKQDFKLKRRHVKILWSVFIAIVILSFCGYYFLQKLGLIFIFLYACSLSICECKIYSKITSITKQETYIRYKKYLKDGGRKLHASGE